LADGTVSIRGQSDVDRWRVTADDLPQVISGQLNDNIVNAYLLRHLKSPSNVKVQNSFFYKSLGRDWTLNLDVSSHDYFLIPIHNSQHWSLAIVCHPSSLNPPVESGKAFRILILNSIKQIHGNVTTALKHHFCKVVGRRFSCKVSLPNKPGVRVKVPK